jgi:hypothetical protein
MNEQTLQGVRLAVAVVNLILRRRRGGARSDEPVAPDKSRGADSEGASSRRAEQYAPAKQSLKNHSGDPEAAARAARTQPYGPPPRKPTSSRRRLPAIGTPQRAAIEAARRQGIRKAKALELANIRAGGAGSRVWAEAELEQIRMTGRFPSDLQWHHDPTIANRPDLAGDPSVIRPVRGGTQDHLDAHGGDFGRPK